MKIMIRLLAMIAVTATLALAGCNTVGGAGEDIEAVGDSIKDAAN